MNSDKDLPENVGVFFMYNPLNIKKMIQEKKYESQLRLLKVMWEKT